MLFLSILLGCPEPPANVPSGGAGGPGPGVAAGGGAGPAGEAPPAGGGEAGAVPSAPTMIFESKIAQADITGGVTVNGTLSCDGDGPWRVVLIPAPPSPDEPAEEEPDALQVITSIMVDGSGDWTMQAPADARVVAAGWADADGDGEPDGPPFFTEVAEGVPVALDCNVAADGSGAPPGGGAADAPPADGAPGDGPPGDAPADGPPPDGPPPGEGEPPPEGGPPPGGEAPAGEPPPE